MAMRVQLTVCVLIIFATLTNFSVTRVDTSSSGSDADDDSPGSSALNDSNQDDEKQSGFPNIDGSTRPKPAALLLHPVIRLFRHTPSPLSHDTGSSAQTRGAASAHSHQSHPTSSVVPLPQNGENRRSSATLVHPIFRLFLSPTMSPAINADSPTQGRNDANANSYQSVFGEEVRDIGTNGRSSSGTSARDAPAAALHHTGTRHHNANTMSSHCGNHIKRNWPYAAISFKRHPTAVVEPPLHAQQPRGSLSLSPSGHTLLAHQRPPFDPRKRTQIRTNNRRQPPTDPGLTNSPSNGGFIDNCGSTEGSIVDRPEKPGSPAVQQMPLQTDTNDFVPQFWHLIIDIARADNLRGIVRSEEIYEFHVENKELLSVVWSVAYGVHKTFSDVIKQLQQLQEQGILEKQSDNLDNNHYTFNRKNTEVTNYMDNDVPATPLDGDILQEISQLQTPLISNEYCMSKAAESATLWKLIIYLMKQPEYKRIVKARETSEDSWIFGVKNMGRLAIAWSCLLKSRRTPKYLASIMSCATNSRRVLTHNGVSLPWLRLKPRNSEQSAWLKTDIRKFGYSPQFVQQIRLLA